MGKDEKKTQNLSKIVKIVKYPILLKSKKTQFSAALWIFGHIWICTCQES